MNISRRRMLTSIAGGMLLAGLGENRLIAANDKPVQIGIIGVGGRGSWLTRLMRDVASVEVVACCDIQTGNLKRGLELAAPQAKGYDDYRQLLDDPRVEAVIVATPLWLHAHMTLAALAADKHVYCEKTMTFDIAESIQVTKAAKASGLVFQTGYQHRYNPLYRKLKEILDSGICGTLTSIVCHYDRHTAWRKPVVDPALEELVNWRLYRRYSGGLMAELCSHQIDVVNWFTGSRPVQVTGLGRLDYWKDGRDIFDHVQTLFRYPGGFSAAFDASTTNAHFGVSMKFLGTDATLEIRGEQGQQAFIYRDRSLAKYGELPEGVDAVSGATQRTQGGVEVSAIHIENSPKDDALASSLALDRFASVIRTGGKPRSNEDNGHVAGVCVHLANEAMRSERMVNWTPDYDLT